ncbi:glycosyltransferase [bacterium]|nr:glycosyltransferase [bacterium]
MKKYKFMILYSKYEGFPFSLVEALSQGVPIIVKNTFLSASYLCNSETGLLLPTSTTIEDDIELIRKFISISNEKYHQLQINCINFYNENLNIDIFTKK